MSEQSSILEALGVDPADLEAKSPQDLEIEFRLEQANVKHQAVEQNLSQAVFEARDAGRFLLQAKAACPHGTWLRHLGHSFEGSARQAQRYMQIAQNWDRLESAVNGGLALPPGDAPDASQANATRVSHLSLRGVLSLLAEPQEAPELPPEPEPVEVEVIEGEITEIPVPSTTPLNNPDAHNEHYTPDRILQAVYQCFGGWPDLDPCSNPGEPNVHASVHYDRERDGLQQPWLGRVFCNPPYNPAGELQAWTEKLLAEVAAGRVSQAIYLVPAYTDTGWWALLREHPVCLVRGRLRFKGNSEAARFPSAVFYLGHNVSAFGGAFAEIGDFWLCSDLED